MDINIFIVVNLCNKMINLLHTHSTKSLMQTHQDLLTTSLPNNLLRNKLKTNCHVTKA